MNSFRVRLSLRYKLLLILITLPLISLGLYLAMATDLFKADKIAYVHDSSAAVSSGLANQVRMETQNTYAMVRTIVEAFDFNARDFSTIGKDLFAKNDKIRALMLFRREASGEYVKMGQIAKDEVPAQRFVGNSDRQITLRDSAVTSTVFLAEDEPGTPLMDFAFRLGEKEEANHMVVMGVYMADDLVQAFQSKGIYSSFVMDRFGKIAVGKMDVVDSDLAIFRGVLHSAALSKEGSGESKLSDSKMYLISYASVGLGDLYVISKVDKKKALKAVEVLVLKSLLFFAALLSSTLIISVIVSNRLTSTLRELFEATKQIAQGDFNIQVQARSEDEVGGLAISFNWMASEVSRLLSATAEKARMESELSTVRTVQETLFPPAQSQFGPIRISGHFEPASECGGDWWSYSRIGNKIFLWIGDATGHGAPAALITSAARSAAAVIEMFPEVTPASALTIMNRAIHQTSKGQIMMTFFIACIDLENRKFTYASASHDPPYMMRRTGEKLSKKDLVPLNEVNGPRLGDQKDHQYQEIAVDFSPGDLIFFYTDGILDIQDPDGKKWGERTFLKTLIDSANLSEDIETRLNSLRGKVDAFRSGAQLIDDVTMVMCQFDKDVA